MENHEKSGFARVRLPWLIVVAALMVYVLTLNRWVSLASLPVVAGVASKEAVLPLNAPLLFAALICGLQLSFWEHASAATGEMLDLLLFAYIIRCLLEYRIDQRESWLTRSALVYGIAATNNYAMLGFLPAYLAALIWIKGLSFFEFRFVARMFGWGTGGLTLYLFLPLLAVLDGHSGLGF